MLNRKLMNTVRPFVSAIAVLTIAGMLVLTIYLTRFSMQWPTFLGGILVAAVLAEATRVSRAEWVLLRRTTQLAAIKDKFEREAQLRKNAEDALTVAQPRLHLVDDVVPTMIALIDATGHCRYHNHSFRAWLNLRPEKIDGHHVSEVLGAKVYQEIASSIRQTLDGHPIDYKRVQKMPNGAIYKLAVEHIPQFDGGGKVTGFYMLTNDVTEPADAGATDDDPPADFTSQDLYIDSLSEQITGLKDAGMQISSAIENNEFRLFRQSIAVLNPANGSSAEYDEILIRLMEEEEGMMPPGAFFPLAEKLGLMRQLDRWVVQHVAERISLRSQQNKWHAGSIFFINVAEATIADTTFPNYLELTLKEYGVSGNTLCFEISHDDLAGQNGEVAAFAQAVREHGCRVALCGFGRDRISFDLIRGFQVEFLKIDGNLVFNLAKEPVSLAKIRAICQVARKIGVKTIAEMVESSEITTALKSAGVDYAQGFGISRPEPLAK